MDFGPEVNRGVMWCFIAGDPTVELIASFGRILALGNLQWVIIPIVRDGFDRFEFEEPSGAAWVLG